MRNCPEIISIFQDAIRCPLPATRSRYPKAKPVMLLRAAGSRQQAASPEMWEFIKDNS